ncbi:MAG: 16S rRNA (uracil(1498)-N(3))-methyltransferase [Bacteroidales bacterium]|nr:16S rRNA (uracil(1498)-N(3))-methyltransferase [Bacteroidales bacterium]
MELLVDKDFDMSGVLCEEESKHCVSVMRHRVGDEVFVTDGQGVLYKCKIVEVNKGKQCLLSVISSEVQPQPKHHLHMAVAPTKNTDRFEWFVEKAVEMGVGEITPIVCEHSERNHLRIDRLERLVIAACKQSLKFYIPRINEPCKASDLIKNDSSDQKFILHCMPGEKQHLFNLAAPFKSSLVMIGPEGDFSQNEVALAKQCGFNEATLGQERLRTETAAMVACQCVDLKNNIAE